jgi:hypothetical protein
VTASVPHCSTVNVRPLVWEPLTDFLDMRHQPYDKTHMDRLARAFDAIKVCV